MDIFLCPAHFRDVNKTFNTSFKLYKSAVIGDVGDTAFHLRTDWEFAFDIFPWVRHKLLHAQRNTLCFSIKADNLHFYGFPNLQSF